MENFAAITIIVLVGMAIPILFLLAAVVFDLIVGVYLLFRYVRDHTRRHGGAPNGAGNEIVRDADPPPHAMVLHRA